MASWTDKFPCNWYGSMFQYRESNTIDVLVANTWYIVDEMETGLNRGFTFQNAQELKCTKAGTYKVDWSACFRDGGEREFEFAIFVNSTHEESTSACFKFDEIEENPVSATVGGTGIIILERDDLVTLRVKGINTTSDPTVEIASVALIRVNK